MLVDDGANGNYNSLAGKLTKRFSKGLTTLVSYTWSKSIDETSGIRTQDSDTLFSQDGNCMRCERGLSAFDNRHRLVVSGLYDLPVGKGTARRRRRTRSLNAVAGGWQLGSIVTWRSGFPINPAPASIAPTPISMSTGRTPPASASRSTTAPRPQWFNTAAFALQPLYPFGNAAPQHRHRTARLHLGFLRPQGIPHAKEGHALQFRWEAFNFLNHPVWGLPNANFEQPAVRPDHVDQRFHAADAVRPEVHLLRAAFPTGETNSRSITVARSFLSRSGTTWQLPTMLQVLGYEIGHEGVPWSCGPPNLMKTHVGQVGNLRTDCQSVPASRARLITCPAMTFNGAARRRMLAILGFATVLVLLAVILTRKMTPLTALIAVPVLSALIGGFGLQTAGFIVHGIQSVSAVAGMFIFAIAYFGIMTDAGMLDPIVDRILAAVGSNPPRIVVWYGASRVARPSRWLRRRHVSGHHTCDAAAVSAARHGQTGPRVRGFHGRGREFPAMDGPMITVRRFVENPRCLHFQPARSCADRRPRVRLCVHMVARQTGSRKAKLSGTAADRWYVARSDKQQMALRRPRRVWINLGLTLVLITAMIWFKLEAVAVFMVGVVLALQINYPDLQMQRERIDAHAKAALMMAGVLFAAGAFTGIMRESGMLGAMAKPRLHSRRQARARTSL